MPGALFSRVKTWVTTEDVTYSDLNAEFDNILQNLVPLMLDDYSTNTAQMQVTTDPGEVGTESLATTLGGEFARLRHILREITGEDEWYESPVSSLAGLANAIGTGLTDNRLVSGKIRTAGSNSQPIFLNANGAAKTVAVKGATTNFIYYVDGIEYTISTDVTLTGLTAAPSSNNTCLINDAVAAGQYWTKNFGEDGTEITIDTAGSEITALIGKFAAFKLVGAGTEYFIAYVKSSTQLTRAYRGYFFDSSDAPVTRTTYTNNDTITLMKMTWVFAKTDGTLTATYTNPIYSKDEPSSPAIGDYWYDIDDNTWKVYGVGSYSAANATLVGMCIQDGTNTVAARSFEFFAGYDDFNTNELIYSAATQVKSNHQGAVTSVWGTTIKADNNIRTWDITLDLDSGVSESASTYYYCYLTNFGDVIISTVKPFDRREDLQGYYHPHSSWRCLGQFFNNSSQDIEQVESYFRRYDASRVRSIIATDLTTPLDNLNLLSGASFTTYLPPAAYYRGKEITFFHNGTSLTQVYTLDGFGSETIGGSTTYVLYTNGESLKLMSDGSNWIIVNHYAQTGWVDSGNIVLGGTTTAPTRATTRETDKLWWRRNGDTAIIRGEYAAASGTGGDAGSANWLFGVPANMTIDTAKVTVNAVVGTPFLQQGNVGDFAFTHNAVPYTGSTYVYDGTYVRATIHSAALSAVVTSASFSLATAQVSMSWTIHVPITGWKS